MSAMLAYIPDKKETHTITFTNCLENNNKLSYSIYTDLKCVNRTVYPMNLAHKDLIRFL